MWYLDKQTCGILHNSIIPLDLDFMHPDQIANMSLNDLRRRVATHDKTLIGPWMEKMLVSLDSRH
jgi:hypothetical protein